MVWTEPTFLICTFASIYCLGKYLDTGRLAPLALAGVLAGLAFATRYAGAALMLASGLLVLFAAPRAKGFVRRVGDAFVYSLLSAGAMFAWLARNAMTTRDADGHAFAVHLPNRSDVKNALTTVAGWVVPMGDTASTAVVLATMVFGLIVALGALVLLIKTARNARRARAQSTIDDDDDDARETSTDSPASAARAWGATGAGLRRALVWFVPIYAGFILVSVSFFDAHVPLDRRILSPVHVALIVLVTGAIASGGLSSAARRGGILVIALLIAVQGLRAAQWAAGAPQSRQLGYANREWRTSPTMAAVAALPDDLTIFSNGVDAIYLRANRFAKPLPKVTDPTKAARDSKFRKYMNGLRDYLAAYGGYVVYFDNIPRAYVVPADQLIEAIPMELVQQLPDGAIYRRPPNPPGATTNPTSKPATDSPQPPAR
jgi:4-amino-4-deoxy-L-arabinose transferase-like glycosyltransferase